MFAKAPTLAWLLAALGCFLAGMAVTEGRHQAVAVAPLPPVELVVTVEVAYLGPSALGLTPTPTPAPIRDPCPSPAPACDPESASGPARACG